MKDLTQSDPCIAVNLFAPIQKLVIRFLTVRVYKAMVTIDLGIIRRVYKKAIGTKKYIFKLRNGI